MTGVPDTETALQAEGARLARRLAQILHASLDEQVRIQLIGHSLASNLIGAFVPTVEHVSRRAGRPLHTQLEVDAFGQIALHVVAADGATRTRLGGADLLDRLLFTSGRLHPVVAEHLQRALGGSEHQATRALVDCLRSKPVLNAMQRQLTVLLSD
ncbi:hypothetical protein DEDE109153_03770 [Deinococcus deserti]|uniref:Uncharacterized protein n=1 Tax=Deinococcus deserti (strain DSM 17065 / CIP 109153 / LMG 22923 / VCD115) TaxID=546414 RepID=C1D1K7_DEIDV|nr:hypothetical protein [Deinococcus deserti]ACO45731.1 hypothetical protein Deide_08580 [Deinococcus deserti VCD115]